MTWVGRVQAYINEDSTQGGDPTEVEPFPQVMEVTDDALELAGVILNDYNGGTPIRDQNVTITRTGSDLVFKDSTNGTITLVQLTKVYDSLLDDDPTSAATTLTVTRSAGLVTKYVWTFVSNGLAIKEVDYTRTAGKISSIVTKIFSLANGTTVVAQKTETINRTAGLVTTIGTTRDV